jgi:hypothetical protein
MSISPQVNEPDDQTAQGSGQSQLTHERQQGRRQGDNQERNHDPEFHADSWDEKRMKRARD